MSASPTGMFLECRKKKGKEKDNSKKYEKIKKEDKHLKF